MISVTRYNTVNKNNKDAFRSKKIITHVPSPTDEDYAIGYITRYFVQKVNDINSFIYEVSTDSISLYIASPLYIWAELDWKISGDNQSIMDANKKSLNFVSKKMQKISLYLPNLLQFSK
jgi:hypothetical protein